MAALETLELEAAQSTIMNRRLAHAIRPEKLKNTLPLVAAL
jgi:hypothetical protein